MKFDLFLSLCQAEVDGHLPSEQTMLANFFDQVELADRLGFEVAWVGEGHFSSEVQKSGPDPVIPHFKGEVALNTDVLTLAGRIFHKTRRIEVGAAIRNILCNGGPLAHAEMIRMFLSVHGVEPSEARRLHIGFASGRFPYANRPYGILPRNRLEELAWSQVKGKLFMTATEVFLRALRGDAFASSEVAPLELKSNEFSHEQWAALCAAGETCGLAPDAAGVITLAPFWNFERLAVVPRQAPLHLLNLIVGSHDPAVQALANRFFPCWVFNLSITPGPVIEATHQHMAAVYQEEGRQWQRSFLPRTSLVFVNADPQLSAAAQQKAARRKAEATLTHYWEAMQGTVSPRGLEEALGNALWGNPEQVAAQIRSRFHAEDRLMLWFDFYNHDNEAVKRDMRVFCEQVRPLLA